MIDLHTHILPKMDDGASSSDLSLEMLRMEAEQGVDTVVLTPIFIVRRKILLPFSSEEPPLFIV